jgi:hypothetical protein
MDRPGPRLARPRPPGRHAASAVPLVDLCALPIPPDWPQFGIELTTGWARQGRQGAIAHT